MRRLSTIVLTAALALAGLAMDTTDEYVPVVESERVYAHCGDTQKVSNVEGGSPFAMDTTAPEASFTAGAGCGTADVVLTDPVEDDTGEFIELTGTYTGNLDSLTVELHMIDAGVVRVHQTTGGLPQPGDPVPATNFTEIYAPTELFIDGHAAGFLGEARYPAERSETGASVRLRMTVTDIGLLAEDEAGEHTVTLRVKTADYHNGDSGGWVLDAAEVPTGIEFNPAEEDWAPYQVTSF